MEMSSGLWCGCGAATLKPREAKVVQTRGTDKVSVGKAQRTCGSVVIQKGVKVSRLSGTESVMGQRDKFEFYALLLSRSTVNL